MAKKIIVEVKVISKKDKKKGEVITVSFPLEKSIYDAINDSDISDEEKIKYFTDYYTDWYTEDNYQKSHPTISLDYESDDEEVFEIADEGDSPLENTIRMDTKEKVWKAISKLNKRYQYAITEVELNGRKQRDVAKELGINEASFSKLLGRALLALKEELEKLF